LLAHGAIEGPVTNVVTKHVSYDVSWL